MKPNTQGVLVVATFALGVASLLALWLVFELRYVWYVPWERLVILRAGILMAACAIALLWLIYPSRIAVAALGAAGLFFPPFIDPRYVEPSPGFLAPALMIFALLVGATQLRRVQRTSQDARA